MTFDHPPWPARDGVSRRAARFAVSLSVAAVLTSAGCWEEIRYQPSESATPTKRVEPAGRGGAETTATESEASDAVTTTPAAAVPEPSEDELFGGDADASAADNSGAPLGYTPTPEPTASPVEPPATDGLPPAETEPPVAPVTPQERLDAWKAASGWSLAMAIAAKGLPADRYQPYLTEAELAAGAIGIELPPVPELSTDEQSDPLVGESLLTGGSVALVIAIGDRLDGSAGGCAKLAIDTNLLLLTYSPENAGELAYFFSAIAEGTELPRRFWEPLVRLLAQGADFKEVRAAVFALHKDVAAYLEEAARRGGTLPGQ